MSMSFTKMFNIGIKRKFFVSHSYRKLFSTCTNKSKVVVCGGCGGIGQPLSLLLKMNPLITELAVQDLVKHTPGVAKDLSHIEYPACITGHIGESGLKEALQGANVVAVPAGIPRKPGMSRDDLFDSNADLIKSVADAVAEICPKAMIVIVTNPINSVIPIACEAMRAAGKLDPKRIFGISTLDNVRAATFVAEKLRVSPKDVNVPVIGGHSGITIIPVFSKAYPKLNFPLEEIKALTKHVQDAGTEVVKAKAGAGSATLSTAYATARFINSLLRAMQGEPNIVECAYIQTDVCPVIPYFAGPVVLGKNGAEKMCPIVDINDYEREQLSKAIPALQKEIQKGIEYVKKKNCQKKSDPCANIKKSDPCGESTKGGGSKSGAKPDGSPSGVGAKCPPGSTKSKKHDACSEPGKSGGTTSKKPDGSPSGVGAKCPPSSKHETCADSGKGKPDGSPSGVGAKCPPGKEHSKKGHEKDGSSSGVGAKCPPGEDHSKKGHGKPDGSPSGVGAKCPPGEEHSKKGHGKPDGSPSGVGAKCPPSSAGSKQPC